MPEEKEEQKTLWKSDPERYAKCRQPFADSDAANAAMKAFFEGVSELRETHLIADVEIVVKDSMGKGEDAGSFMSSAHFGDSLESEAMLAYAFGRAQRNREKVIARLLAAKSE